jgi:hypothetical protein
LWRAALGFRSGKAGSSVKPHGQGSWYYVPHTLLGWSSAYLMELRKLWSVDMGTEIIILCAFLLP